MMFIYFTQIILPSLFFKLIYYSKNDRMYAHKGLALKINHSTALCNYLSYFVYIYNIFLI